MKNLIENIIISGKLSDIKKYQSNKGEVLVILENMKKRINKAMGDLEKEPDIWEL